MTRIYKLLGVGILMIGLTACSDLTRSAFQNEYIEKCKTEGVNSNSRCECFAETIDKEFTKKDKQLLLNPNDNPIRILALMKPLLEISKQCIAQGR